VSPMFHLLFFIVMPLSWVAVIWAWRNMERMR